jgi:hypothetical protein
MKLLMSKLSHLKIKNIFCLSSIFLFSVTSLHADPAQADVNGIPYNAQFPKAEYPYSQAPDGCSGWQSPKEVRDNWGPVSFTGACNTHDKCYYTLGSNWNTCNERFYSDLRAACERDLRTSIRVPAPTLSNPLRTRRVDLPPDPVRLTPCYAIATSYYGGVQAGVVFDVFKDAQSKQKQYNEWIASIKSPPNSNIQEGNFHNNGSVYYSNGQGAYCGFTSPLHYRLSSTRPWGQWIEISAIPQSMRSDGSCRVIIREGNFHHNGSVYYSNGQGAYCGFTSPDHYKKKSGRRWGDWLEINEPVPFQTFMRYDGPC